MCIQGSQLVDTAEIANLQVHVCAGHIGYALHVLGSYMYTLNWKTCFSTQCRYTQSYLITDKNRCKSFALVYPINFPEKGGVRWSIIWYCMLKQDLYFVVSQLDNTELSLVDIGWQGARSKSDSWQWESDYAQLNNCVSFLYSHTCV